MGNGDEINMVKIMSYGYRGGIALPTSQYLILKSIQVRHSEYKRGRRSPVEKARLCPSHLPMTCVKSF